MCIAGGWRRWRSSTIISWVLRSGISARAGPGLRATTARDRAWSPGCPCGPITMYWNHLHVIHEMNYKTSRNRCLKSWRNESDCSLPENYCLFGIASNLIEIHPPPAENILLAKLKQYLRRYFYFIPIFNKLNFKFEKRRRNNSLHASWV